MSFVSELKRRKVFQVAAVYLVVAWLIMQVVDVVNEPLRLPEWFATVAILIVAIGFPIALILSWAFDLTPEGVVRDEGTSDKSSGRRIEYVFTGLLVLAVGTLLYREFSPPEQVVEVVAEESQREVLPNSVAVLPFENLSPNPDDAYFAAGVHESILNELAKIQDVSVIARTSVLRYADRATSIREIADELNVETVMEGSVRYAGDRVRITAQLIDPATGAHLWSEEYERDLADVFAIQSDIATRIAMALEAELLASEQESIDNAPTDSFEAYALYIRAAELRRSVFDSADTRATMLSYLNQAIALDPDFALAHAAKAAYYVILTEVDLGTPQSWLARRAEIEALARAAAETALGLDPGNGRAESALATLHMYHRREAAAREGFERALRLSPNDPTILIEYAYLNAYTDQHETASNMLRRAIELDPNNPQWRCYLGDILFIGGDIDAAIETNRAAIALDPTYGLAHVMLGVQEAISGNSEVALDQLRKTETLLAQAASPALYADLAYAYARAGSREDAVRLVRQLEGTAVEHHVGAGSWALAYLALGNSGEVLRWLEMAAADLGPDEGFFEQMTMRANYWNDPILDQPEFVEVRSRLGFRE